MLLQFSVKNFRSIKEKVVLSLEGSSDKNLSSNFFQINKSKILNSIAIFGANASGKSNIFLALTAAILTVRLSNNRQIGEPLPFIEPFAFDKVSIKEPTEFEFVFIANNGIKYVYGFSATRIQIIKEYLYAFTSNKASTIFERDETANKKYRFTSNELKAKLNPIVERNTVNKLFLATAASWNCEEVRAPLLWFQSGINTYDSKLNTLFAPASLMFEKDNDGSLKEFTKQILREADINISDYTFESREVLNNSIPNFIVKANGLNVLSKEYRISMKHEIVKDDGTIETYELALNSESKGTEGLFFLSPILKRAFETGETICVDEFDISLHPLLVKHLIGLFSNPTINKNKAQLIISTHTVDLLNLTLLRRDQIYFVNKSNKTAESELYSLDEFSPRTSENIRKAYLLGRFGSVPNIIEEGCYD
ncbi:MAG: ATP-binding protein [Candidatus Riflebacteria bacterium]|nr:ATP-binding protein [Candidatus Riflebacteria bacterium]